MNEVQASNGNLPSTQVWGTEGMSREDLLIPRIQLMQDISEHVKSGKFRPGVLINSTTNEVIADKGESCEIIPILGYREWIINDVDDRNKEKYRCRIRMTPENEIWAREDVENGKAIRRTKCINFFCLLASKPDELPMLVSFKKTSMYAGKKLSTHFQISAMKNQAPASQVFKIGGETQSYNGYSFYVFNVEPSRKATSEELALAKKWYDSLNTSNVEVADEAGPVGNAEEVPF